jgi:hypothetical protein
MKPIMILAPVLLLAACGHGGGNNSQQANAAGGGTGAGASAPGFTLQPGEWETTMTMELPVHANMPAGMPPIQIPPTTTRSCLTPEQVSRANASFLGGGNQHGVDCDYSHVTIAGGRISGVSTCRRSGVELSMTMDGTFGPNSYDVSQQIRTTMGGRTNESSGHMSGRRIGECQPAEPGK